MAGLRRRLARSWEREKRVGRRRECVLASVDLLLRKRRVPRRQGIEVMRERQVLPELQVCTTQVLMVAISP
jgi:hypothetical protein